MNKESQKQVSVYLKAGEKAATSYYRFYQYFKTLDADIEYHLMIPDSKWDTFFPIAQQSKTKQVYIFFFIYFRVLWSLLSDIIRKPNYVIVSRCIINKVLPWSYKALLRQIKRNGAKIIWDFDDNIIGSEMSRNSFNWFSSVADIIIVGSPLLKDLIRIEDKNKVLLLCTTDGDMHQLLTDSIKTERINCIVDILKVVWVGTFSTLECVQKIVESFEEVGLFLLKLGKQLQLTVVCDKELIYYPKYFKLINIKWNKNASINQMLHSHVGIMPLDDNENNRGKCGFKLIQYLSVGLPVIGSMVGINQMIINNNVGVGVNGLNTDSWTEALKLMADNPERWIVQSNNAYIEWERFYSYENNLMIWKEILQS